MPAFKPRIYIEVQPGRDFMGRSRNCWKGTSPSGKVINLGAVCLFSLEETIRDYFRRLRFRRYGVKPC